MSTYRVLGMTCEGCAASVEKAINNAAPDAKAKVDLAAKTVTVAAAIDESTVETAVKAAGFDYDGQA